MRTGFSTIALLFVSAAAAPAQTPGLTIDKEPPAFMERTFDPANPPADMPPLSPGEEAECDSKFSSYANVAGEARQTDATHATVTITQVSVTLRLNITIWLPAKVSQHVVDHETGHRQISEYFYETADQIAERIATPYMGKQFVISGADLRAELSKALREMGGSITYKYTKELKPEPTQIRFDAITDHARNGVAAKDAVDQAVKEAPREPTQ